VIEAVLFDFGRVVSAPKPPSLFARYEKELGLRPGTLNTVMFDSPHWRDALLGRKTMKEFWYAVGPELGLRTSRAVDDFRSRYYADERINDEVVEVVRRLHGRVKLAILSNSPPGLKDWLAEWGLLHYFDTVFCSGDEGVVKPDPRAYCIVLERLGAGPRQAVFIDDARENVEAAESLGIRGILYDKPGALMGVDSLVLRGLPNQFAVLKISRTPSRTFSPGCCRQ